MTYEALKTKKYWFTEDDLLVPIDWKYIDSLPKWKNGPDDAGIAGWTNTGDPD